MDLYHHLMNTKNLFTQRNGVEQILGSSHLCHMTADL